MKRIRAIICSAIVSLALSACALCPVNPPSIPPSGKLNIDRALLEPCKEPGKLKSGEEQEVIAWINGVKVILKECSSNHQGLINAIESVK